MASPMGTARCRRMGRDVPWSTPRSRAAASTVFRGVRIDEVGLTAKRTTIGWPVEMPPQNAAGVVGEKARPAVVAHPHLVGVILARKHGGRKTRADLDPLHRVDAHQRAGKIGVKLGVNRRAQAGRHALRRSPRRSRQPTIPACARHRGSPRNPGPPWHRDRRTDCGPPRPNPRRRDHRPRSHLDQRGSHIEAGHDLAGDGAGRHPHRRLTGRGPSAAAVVVQAVFDVIGVAGMTRTIDVLDRGIVLGALIDVVDQQANRRARRDLVAVASSANTPERILTVSGSCRWVV